MTRSATQRESQQAGKSAASLRLGGLTAMTSIDYPGELAAVVYCQGCPWHCGYCHNADMIPADDPPRFSWDQVLELLQQRQGLLDAVVFSGGEPTLQPALPAAIEEVRTLGFKVGLHTGGPYPERLKAVLPLVDWVGLDIKALPADYPLVTGAPGSGERAWQNLALLLDSGVDHEVRTTPLPGLDDTRYLSELMRRLTAAGVRRYALQRCKLPALTTQRTAPLLDNRALKTDAAEDVAPLPETPSHANRLPAPSRLSDPALASRGRASFSQFELRGI